MGDWISGAFALAGTGLGWLFGRADSWVDKREQKIRVYRRTASLLLDIRHVLTTVARSVKGSNMVLLKALEIRLLKRMSPERVKEVLSAFDKPELLFGLTSKVSSLNIGQIQGAYADVMADLAECDAVLAYYLRGKTELWTFVDILRDQVIQWSSESGGEPVKQHDRSSYELAATAMFMLPMRAEVTEFIDQLARKLPRAERKGIHQAMEAQNEKLGDSLTPALVTLVRQLERSILKQAGIEPDPTNSGEEAKA